MVIGDNDGPVIRHPWTREPYIPGSSIKGKIRSLSEHRLDKVPLEGKPHGCDDVTCFLCKVFGPHNKKNHPHGPTRLIVRDANLHPDSIKKMIEVQEKGYSFTESKTENWIDRRSGMAGDGGLRVQERVVTGTEFALTLSVRIFKDDDKKKNLGLITKSLDLTIHDSLGGSGSRGYGWAEFQYEVGVPISTKGE